MTLTGSNRSRNTGTTGTSGPQGSPKVPGPAAPGWVWPSAFLAAGIALVFAGLYGAVVTEQELSDPGAITRWGLPITKIIHNLAWSATAGVALFAATIIPRFPGAKKRGRQQEVAPDADEQPAYAGLLKLATISATVWTLSSVAQMIFTYSDLAGMPLNNSPGFSSGLLDYLMNISVGRAWFWMTVIAALTTTLIYALHSPTAMFWVTALSFIGIIPLALVGHSAAGDDHFAAVNAIGLHLLGVLLWVGGLMALMWVAPWLVGTSQLRRRNRPESFEPLIYTTVQRFSTLAGLAIFLVVFSGIASMVVRMARPTDILEPYGMLAVAKIFLTVVLGLLGLAHRQRVIPQLKTSTNEPAKNAKTLLWRLIGVEIVIMFAVMAIASVLARTEPPKPEERPLDASPARILTKYELPPELTPARWITEWRFNWLWVIVAILLLVWYLRGIAKLRQRGDTWSWYRTVSWIAGLIVLTWVTSGAPAIYGLVLFSAHMADHMLLTMVIPLFLVLGAPMTLALRALDSRQDGTRGPREWLLWLLNSWYAKIITHPIFAAINFAGSLVIFYYTPFFGFALGYHFGHELMNVHFLLTGFIFASVMVGIDPLPHRPNYPLRLVLLLATMVFHAFIGVSLTTSESLLEAAWFSSIGRDWGLSAIADQQMGGGIMWGTGEFPTVLMAIITLYQWRQSDVHSTARRDKRVDRQGDAELDAWNAMYAQMAEQDAHDVTTGAPRLPAQLPDTPAATRGRNNRSNPDLPQE